MSVATAKIAIRDYSGEYFEFVLECNNINAPKVGFVTPAKLRAILAQSNYCKIVFWGNTPAGFVLCLPENVECESMNYAWVAARYTNFLYIDRVAILPAFQNRQLGRSLYTDLIDFAKAQKCEAVLCEVNLQPLNAGSLRFHKRFDFTECGSQFTENGTKEVQYFVLKMGEVQQNGA